MEMGGEGGGENETSCTDCNQSGWLQLQAPFSKIGDEYENICVAGSQDHFGWNMHSVSPCVWKQMLQG